MQHGQVVPAEPYTRSVYGGDRSAADGVRHAGTAAAPSVIGSQQAQKQQAGQQQQQQAETAWSLLGKMYSSQVLAYMVAITDAQALVRRMRSMRPGPPLHLPHEVQCMDVWQVLQGSVQQQRVWTFGMQMPATLPASPSTESNTASAAPDSTGGRLQSASSPAAAAPAAEATDIHSVVQPCISSREPQSVKDGVRFTCCAAGQQHSAAAAEGGYVYTWGSNDKGQLGCDTATQNPVALHVLDTLESAVIHAISSEQHTSTSAPAATQAPSTHAIYSRMDSLKLLGSTVKLPPSLISGLQQQRQREQESAAEQQQLLLQELLAHPQLEQQQQLAGRTPAPQPSAAQAAAHKAVLSGLSTSSMQHQPQQQAHPSRPQALAVYQLHLGQAVRSIACGAHHTLAALASSGLMAWGWNDKGQLGAPAGLYRTVSSPMRIHGFDGQRLVCVSAGAKHSAAVQEGGGVITWGHGKYGRLGGGGTPDILPPGVVAGLRGCVVTQVACGAAHTLALTADGRVYACGFNGQGALGTGDEQDRLYPVLVQGLPSCIQVAAAASSMALSSTGDVYMWGGAAGRQLQSAHNTAQTARDSSSNTSLAADAGTGHSSCMQKHLVPWLAGVKAITCGVDTAAAVSSTGEVLLWGSRQCLPESMLGTSQALACNKPSPGAITAAAAVTTGDGASVPGYMSRPAGAATDGQAGGTAVHAAAPGAAREQLVKVQLSVLTSGAVQVVLTCQLAPISSAPEAAAGSPTPQQAASTEAAAAAGACKHSQGQGLPCPDGSSAVGALPGSWPVQNSTGRSTERSTCGFEPQQEPVADVVCGASHHVVLCQASQHLPSSDELKAAILAMLRAYITSFHSTNTSSLNLLMQQQQQYQSEANYAGSIVDGPARSIKSVRPVGYAGSVVSFAGSTTSRAVRQAHAAAAGNSHEQPVVDPIAGSAGDRASVSSGSNQHSSSIVRGGGPCVSFAGGSGLDASSAVGPEGGPGASASGSKGSLLSKAERSAGYAASVAAGSVSRGPAGSVAGSLVGWGVPGRPGSAGAGPISDSLGLHGALVLCKEICLLDNITEHLDVIKAFEVMLHRKRGRLGPMHTPLVPDRGAAAAPLAAHSSTKTGLPLASSASTVPNAAATPAAGDSRTCVAGAGGPEPDMLTVVHVVRPNEPAVPVIAAAEGSCTQATASGSRPGSPLPACMERASSTTNSRPGSSGMFGRKAVGRAAAASSGMDSITALDAGEMLEMLVLLMKERHPCYRRQTDALLKMLAGWHLTWLKGRRSDQGPPWLLRQVLQPEILSAVESPSTTELLHGIYVHLAGSSGNTADLSMHLTDIRMGLRFAAGFRTLQDIPQQQHGKARQQPAGKRAMQGSRSSSRRQQQPSGMAQHGYRSSTESSRGHGAEPIPYSISMQAARSPSQAAGWTTGSAGGNNSSCCTLSFQLPLYKLAAFIRAAKLLPRLLDKYISQLKLQGQEQRVAASARAEGLPVMPCLQVQVQQAFAGTVTSTSQSGQKRRTLPGGADAQQQGLQAEISRLAPLKEVSSVSSMAPSLNGTSAQQHHPKQPQSLPQGDISDFFEPLPSQRLDPYFRSGSIRSRPSMAGGLSRRASVEGGRTAREGGVRGRLGGAARPTSTPTLDASMLDAHALNNAELIPVRSKSACLQLIAATTASGHSSAGRSRAAGPSSSAAASKKLLQLPPACSSPNAQPDSSEGSWNSSGNGGREGSPGQAAQYGGAAWQQVLDSQQQQQQTSQGVQGKRPGAALSGGKVTYQQQQSALQQQRQAEAALAAAAEAQEAACQYAWIVCMLVELLGSCLITPPSTAAVHIPPPGSSRVQPAATSSWGRGQPDDDASSGRYCRWERGYHFVEGGNEAGSQAEVSHSGSGRVGSSSNSGGLNGSHSSVASGCPLDLLNASITYPQFVEVLLCLMATRAVSILEPDVKQISPLAMDEEMEDHARVLMEHISKWRSTQLTPWKQQEQQAPSKGPAANKGNGQAQQKPAAEGQAAAGASPLEGQQMVSRVYGAYSSMKLGSSVLGLHKEGYLQLLTDAGMLEASSSELSVQDTISIFKKVAATSAAEAAPPAPEGPDSNGTRPARMGPEQRQSTFMHCVTQQIMQRLEAGVRGAPDSQTDTAPEGDQPAVAAGLGDLGTTVAACTAASTGRAAQQALQKPQETQDTCGGQGPASRGSLNPESPPGASTASTSRPGSASSQDSSDASSTTSSSSTSEQPSSGESSLTTVAPAQQPLPPGAVCSRRPAPAASAQEGIILTSAQFLQAMVLLSRRCFPRIANGSRAWRLLLERHVQPLADKKRSRYDLMIASLGTPGVVALLMAWAPQLQELHAQAAATHSAVNTAACVTPGQLPSEQQQQGRGLSLAAFLEVLQEKGVIPQLLEPCDVQEVLRQLLVTHADPDALFTSLDCSQFTTALSMCGLAAASSRRLQHTSSLQHSPEQQLAAFLTLMGLSALPGQQQLTTPQPAAGAAAAVGSHGLPGATGGQSGDSKAAGGKQTARKHSSTTNQLRQQLAADPYIEWWSLQFDPAAESKAHDHLSSLNYLPVMLQEVVQPPGDCPPEVLALLSAAQSAQQCRDVAGALDLLEQAELAWRAQLAAQATLMQHQHSQDPGCPSVMLPPAAVLYLAVSASACLLSAGRDDAAREVLQGCAEVLTAVHEAGADAAVWHAAAGVAKYHCDDLRGAFEHCVRAYMMRSECGSLGPGHPHTAAAGHNLGVVLDCLGKCSRGLQLVQEAHQVFAATLGPQHIRTLVAARNEQHIKHKIIKLPAQPQEQMLTAAGSSPGSSNSPALLTGNTGLGRKQEKAAAGGDLGRGRAAGAGAKRSEHTGTDSDDESSSGSSEDQEAVRGSSSKGKRGEKKGLQNGVRALGHLGQVDQAGGKGPKGSSRGSGSMQRLRHTGSMQERLQAVVHARQYKEEAAAGQLQQAQVDIRDYTDADHLGAGVFRATAEQRQLYKTLYADIAAHAQGLSSSSYSSCPGLVEVQVLPHGLPASAAAAALAGVGAGGTRVAPAALPAGTSHAAAAGGFASAGTIHSGVWAAPAVSSASLGRQERGTSSSSTLPPTASQAVRHVMKGPLADATIAAVKKPLSLEQARRLRRQQQQQQLAARKRGLMRSGSPDMLDKVY